MGFPEAQARAALQAAMGNPDLAYEFMLTGIPEQIQHIPAASAPAAAAAAATAAAAAAGPAAAAAAAAAVAAPTADGVPSIESLRSHPQFNMLKQLIQSNPQSLPQVLNLIGQQSPQLLQAIHANEAAFLAMMNEPITNAPAPAPAAATPAAAAPVGGMPGMPGMPAGLPGLGPPGQLNPAQMVQMLAAMPPQERAALSAQLGISPEQLNMFMQMVSTMPPEQLQEMLAGAGAGAGARGPPPGTIALTQEEMDSVNRLMALGFSQAQAAQAFIACDRNETLAANFLFESGFDDEMEDAGAFQDGGDDGGDDDNMYS
jgi:UV excision repair protein RAD23